MVNYKYLLDDNDNEDDDDDDEQKWPVKMATGKVVHFT